MQQAGLIFVEQTLERPLAHRVAIVAVRRQVEKDYVNAGVGQLAGDPEAHRAGSDDRGTIDLVCHFAEGLFAKMKSRSKSRVRSGASSGTM